MTGIGGRAVVGFARFKSCSMVPSYRVLLRPEARPTQSPLDIRGCSKLERNAGIGGMLMINRLFVFHMRIIH